MNGSAPYSVSWRRYRRATWTAGLWLVLGFPAAVAMAIGLKLFLSENAAAVGLVALVLVWIIGFAYFGFKVARFRCPRCDGLYFSHSELYFGAGRRCGNCQLSLYANQ